MKRNFNLESLLTVDRLNKTLFFGLFLLAYGLFSSGDASGFPLGCNTLQGSGIGEVQLSASCIGTDPTIVGRPATLTVPATGSTLSYIVSWTASLIGSPTRYELEEHGSMEPAGRYTLIYSGLALSKTVTNQAPGSWSYRVRACTASCSPWRTGSNDIVVTDPNAGGGGGGSTPPPVTPGETPNHDATLGSVAGQFRVDESGQMNYAIALAAAPGRGGITPQLGFSYSSQAGNGQLGVGWSISGLSAISRCR